MNMPRKRKENPEGYCDAFPTRLREVMDNKRTTQKELADYLGLSRQAVSAYCDGSSSPDWRTLTKIRNYFGVSADYLLGLSDNATVEPEVQAVCKYTGLTQEAVETLHVYATGEGMYKIIFDLEEAQKEGAAYLRVISGLLSCTDSRDVWKNAARSVSIDREQEDGGKEHLEQLSNEFGFETVQKVIIGLEGYLLRKENAATFYRQAAADNLKRIIEKLGKE